MKRTKDEAKGKWEGILYKLIGPNAVVRRHGPCPMCGGTDRYRFDNNRNDGDWFCNVCGSGDGFKLLQLTLGVDFAEAARMVDKVMGSIDEQPFKPEINIEERRKKLNEVWTASTNDEIWMDYLVGRGITRETLNRVTDVRGHDRLSLINDGNALGRYPAMVALIRDTRGRPASLHRTYIGDDIERKHRKKIMPVANTITGGYVKLAECTDQLILAEGIETALSMMCATSIPAWACISAHNLREFDSVPESVDQVFICADHDVSFVGQAAAFAVASRMKVRRKKKLVMVMMPMKPGHDMNDWWQNDVSKVKYDGKYSQAGLYTWTA